MSTNKFEHFSTYRKRSYRRDSFMIANDLFSSFKYAVKGLNYAFQTQRNFRIHIFLGILIFILGVLLKLPSANFAILVLTISAILILELINTSIESLVDLTIGKKFHPLAQIAKDCAAASVLLASISSLLIFILILLPELWNLLLGTQL